MSAPMKKQFESVLCSRKTRCLFDYRSLIRFSSNYKTETEAQNAPTNISRLKPNLYRRLKGLRDAHGKPPQPDHHDHSVDQTQTRLKFRRPGIEFNNVSPRNNKLYAQFGSASGISPTSLWPSREFIERELAKVQMSKPLAERIQAMREAKEKEKEEINQHQQHILQRMAKMGEYIQEYEKRKNKRLEKNVQQLTKRQALLEEAREFFGYEVSHQDLKFQQMMEWKEEQEKRARKLIKRQRKSDLVAHQVAKLTAEMNIQSDDKKDSTN